MSHLLSNRKVCERALRKIGAFSINDTAADGEELAEALYWLDMVVAEIAGNERCYWIVPATISVPLTADTASYDLEATMGTSKPDDGVLYPLHAMLKDSDGNEEPLEILRRHEYEALADKDASGVPGYVYFDRLNDDGITMSVYPVQTVSTYTIELVVQQHAGDLTKNKGGGEHGFPHAWQLCLVTLLAAQIGNGPVRQLPTGEVDRMAREGESRLNRLLARENREHVGPRRIQPWD